MQQTQNMGPDDKVTGEAFSTLSDENSEEKADSQNSTERINTHVAI